MNAKLKWWHCFVSSLVCHVLGGHSEICVNGKLS